MPGVSIVFLLKKKEEIKEVNYETIKQDMNYILKKAKVIG